MKKLIIQENQKGFLFKNGRYVRLLEAGRYYLSGNSEVVLSDLGEPLRVSNCCR